MPRDYFRVCRADPRYKPVDAQHIGNGQSRRAECRGLLHLGQHGDVLRMLRHVVEPRLLCAFWWRAALPFYVYTIQQPRVYLAFCHRSCCYEQSHRA